MSKPSVLTVALVLAIAVWLLSLVLFLHLSQYDPYSWASPGQESDLSRGLWLARRTLYVRVGEIAFCHTRVLGAGKLFMSRGRRDVLAV